MQTSRDELVAQLVGDNQNGVKRYSLGKTIGYWSIAAWVFVIVATLWVQALRPSWLNDLLTSPHFAIETASGLLAILLFSLWIFRLGIPGAKGQNLLIAGAVAFGVWVASLLVGLQNPALAFTMEGKRDLCKYEVLIYAVPLLLLGLYFFNRAYVLNWPLSAAALGLLSALIPAWIMQIACMYDPAHILEAHLAPTLVVAFVAGIMGWFIQFKKK